MNTNTTTTTSMQGMQVSEAQRRVLEDLLERAEGHMAQLHHLQTTIAVVLRLEDEPLRVHDALEALYEQQDFTVDALLRALEAQERGADWVGEPQEKSLLEERQTPEFKKGERVRYDGYEATVDQDSPTWREYVWIRTESGNAHSALKSKVERLPSYPAYKAGNRVSYDGGTYTVSHDSPEGERMVGIRALSGHHNTVSKEEVELLETKQYPAYKAGDPLRHNGCSYTVVQGSLTTEDSVRVRTHSGEEFSVLKADVDAESPYPAFRKGEWVQSGSQTFQVEEDSPSTQDFVALRSTTRGYLYDHVRKSVELTRIPTPNFPAFRAGERVRIGEAYYTVARDSSSTQDFVALLDVHGQEYPKIHKEGLTRLPAVEFYEIPAHALVLLQLGTGQTVVLDPQNPPQHRG